MCQAYTLTATDGIYNYSYEKSGVTFTNGKYYAIAVKMNKVLIHTAPTRKTGLRFNGNRYNPDGSEQALVNAGSAAHGTFEYSTDGYNWSTEVPTGTDAGYYDVYYRLIPDEGYSGGVGSTYLGYIYMDKANGWCELSPSSSSGWRAIEPMYEHDEVTTEAFSTITHHGGELRCDDGVYVQDPSVLSVEILPYSDGADLRVSRTDTSIDCSGQIHITCVETQNYYSADAYFTLFY